MSSAPSQIRPACLYPQSHATVRPIRDELSAVTQNKSRCSSIYLDTVEGMSNDFPYTEGEDHHQGLARSHKLSDGSVYFFLTHSEVGEGEHGSLSSYRFGGPTDGDHVLTTHPLTVAPMQQIVTLNERHPSDIVFLPDVNRLDAGYVFLTLEFDRHVVTCYRWSPAAGLMPLRDIPQGFPAQAQTSCSWTAWTTCSTWELPATTGAGASCWEPAIEICSPSALKGHWISPPSAR